MKRRSAKAGLLLVLVVSIAATATPAAAQFTRNGRPARPELTLPDGPVRSVILRSCTACHGIDEYGYYAMGREDWLALVERMKETPSGIVEGAVISDADREILLDWLVAEFGPDATPFPREYIPRTLEESEYLSDGEADTFLAANCDSCHAVDRVHETRLDEDQWRATVVREIGRGAPILVEDAEPLIEWLARTRGLNPAN